MQTISSSTNTSTLPLPSPDQAYMSVSALEGGHISLPTYLVLEGAPKTERNIIPSLSFLLTHSKTGTKLLFDLGLRRNVDSYPPVVQDEIASTFPVTVEQNVSESLIKGHVELDDIPYIILSHIHFDHIGDVSWFPNSIFIVGDGSRTLLKDSYPQNPKSEFLNTSIPNERTRFIGDSDFTLSIADFSRACDFFNDGSLYIIDAPGHLEGHINVLARTSSTGGWILLGGDTCHDHRLLEDGKIAFQTNEKGEIIQCIHVDKDAAEAHLERVKRLRELKEVEVVVAHDSVWYGESKEKGWFLPGFISPRA